MLPSRQLIRDKYTAHLEHLAGNPGEVFDLTAADLRDMRDVLHGMDLTGAVLVGVYGPGILLRNALLRDADLQRVYFRDADLSGSNFDGANLEGAYMVGANLTGCSFKNANLRRADLDGANMKDVDLTGADLEGAFANYAGFKPDGYERDGKGLLHLTRAA